MTTSNNPWSDVSSIANAIQEDAYFVVRELDIISPLVTTFRDMTGMNVRNTYTYNNVTVNAVSDGDDLASQAFTPSLSQTLTPVIYGAQVFVSEARAKSELPENIIADSARELGLALASNVMNNLCSLFDDMTGGTVGAAGSTATWAYLAAAISRARNANKSTVKPLSLVLHEYHWADLAAAASIAGATVAVAPGVQDEMTLRGKIAEFSGVPIYRVFQSPNAADDYYGAVFPREAIAIDWREPMRIEVERDSSRFGWEINLHAIYAYGVLRPELGVQFVFDAQAPTGV